MTPTEALAGLAKFREDDGATAPTFMAVICLMENGHLLSVVGNSLGKKIEAAEETEVFALAVAGKLGLSLEVAKPVRLAGKGELS